MVELQDHLLHMGYIVVVRDDNQRCRHCTELTLLRVRCPGTGVYRQHLLPPRPLLEKSSMQV